jgi:hypothetical protein
LSIISNYYDFGQATGINPGQQTPAACRPQSYGKISRLQKRRNNASDRRCWRF